VLRKLLSSGANVNARDKSHQTPLHRAASQGRVESIALLIDGLDPDNVGKQVS
jgi:ankyrin repeat protein